MSLFRIDMYSNYINLRLEPGKGLFQYEVKFEPDIDSRILRRKLLNQHSANLGRTKTFDGATLYLPSKLPENVSLSFIKTNYPINKVCVYTHVHASIYIYILFITTENFQVTYYHSEHPMDGSRVTLKIIYKKQDSMSENVLFFNILLNRVMRALSLVRIGRQSFNPEVARNIQQHQLEVWPGYVTAINEYEGGLKLCLDIKHRVMRTQTIRDLM